jgi:ferritin-like metal-binding protein YciE
MKRPQFADFATSTASSRAPPAIVSGLREKARATKGDDMPTLSEPRQLFLHRLGDVYTAEKTIVQMLPRLQQEAKDEKLAQGFKKHLDQTRKHVENVEKVFQEFGAPPEARPSPGIEGIKREHDQSVGQVSPQIVDLFAAGAATSTEHYEIASYEGLVTMAKALGKPQAARLLETNLKQDQKMLTETKAIVRRLTNKAARQASGGSRRAARPRQRTRR